MAESAIHMGYVSLIKEYVESILPEIEHFHILVDSPTSMEKPPHVINNYVPDLYYNHGEQLIIGEAKTDEDFDRPHSLDQYLSYLQECSRFPGDSVLILSGSWRISASISNLLRIMKKKADISVKVIVLNELGCFNTH